MQALVQHQRLLYDRTCSTLPCRHRQRLCIIKPQADPKSSSRGAVDTPTSLGGAEALKDVASQSGTDTRADSEIKTTAFLQSSEQQAVAYGFLSATSLAFGVAALAAPQVLLSAVFGGEASLLDTAFTRIAGATMAISAAVEYSIRDAVLSGHLKSTTYQRLMVAVIAKSTLYIAAFMLSPELWNPALASFYPTAAATSIAINVATLQSAFKQAGVQSFAQGLRALLDFSTPKTPASWGYTVTILLYIATVAACYAPEVIFTGEQLSPVGLLLKHTWAPGFLLAAGSCFVLKDAADRGRLGASTFKRLNLGLAVTEAGYSSVFAACILGGLAVNDGSSWSNLAGSVAIVVFCSWQALTAKK